MKIIPTFPLVALAALLAVGGCSGGSGATADGGGSGSTASGGGSGEGAASSAAAALALKLGRPTRLLVGLGTGAEVSDIQSQNVQTDILDRYLVGAGTGNDWPTWNQDPQTGADGYYVDVVAQEADSVGAVPMYTLYQMASNGDGNLADLSDRTFMQAYWQNVVLMFQHIATYGKPALVNFEPDFWGYAERQSGGDATQIYAHVNDAATDCAAFSNDVVGIAGCLRHLARRYAANAYVGFPPSDWGGDTTADVVAFMNQIGAGDADFVVMQTLDRDAGCFEKSPQPSYCSRSGSGWYWDESNQTHPNFQDHLQIAAAYSQGIGGLPLIWWQTPMGAPSSTPGGSANQYRDNRMHYFLTHPSQLVAVGGLGVVFSSGETHQTDLTTDGGQYKTLSTAYFANPAPLP
jgi:hypothetical protein